MNNRKPEMVRGKLRPRMRSGGGGRGGHILHSTPSSNGPHPFLTGLVRSDHCPFFMPCDNERSWLAGLLGSVGVGRCRPDREGAVWRRGR